MARQRHIIIVFDGTGCTAAASLRGEMSNAVRIATAFKPTSKNKIPQIIAYFPGPGTRRGVGSFYSQTVGSETLDIVLEAYIFLCNNLLPDNYDKIHLFGFSRGAAAAKALAGLVTRCGILHKHSLHFLNKVWEFYESGSSVAKDLFFPYISESTIEFIGLFDPVHGPKTRLFDLKLRDKLDDGILQAVELLAMDERRKDFSPHIWSDDAPNAYNGGIAEFQDREKPRRLHQIWIPGGHSDIGNPASHSLISDLSLITMLERVKVKTNLAIDEDFVHKILSNMQAPERVVTIKPGYMLLRNSDRLFNATPSQEIHEIYKLLSGNKMLIGGLKRKYVTTLRGGKTKMKTYNLNPSVIFSKGGTSSAGLVLEAFRNALSR